VITVKGLLMNYDQAAAKYLELGREIDRINGAAKRQVAEINKIRNDLAAWFAQKAGEEGLTNIPTPHGTAYWSTVSSATVADPSVFKEYVISNAAWDLIETRASKLAVKSFIDGHGEPPPGVNFSSVKVFNLRPSSKE